MKDFKSSPKKSFHKRNKSETDVNWYQKRANELKKGEQIIITKKISDIKFQQFSHDFHYTESISIYYPFESTLQVLIIESTM